MLVAQIAPPWIPVPPVDYGGTELMVATLIRGLLAQGVEVSLFASGDSTLMPTAVPGPRASWPPDKFSENLYLARAFRYLEDQLPEVLHSHLENAAGFWSVMRHPAPLVITLHTPISPAKKDYLLSFPRVRVVAVSAFQARQLAGHPDLALIPHGLPLSDYPFAADKADFLLFLGRLCPDKGPHTAIRLAREIRTRLCLAGPVFPFDQLFFNKEIMPHVDNDAVVYVGPVDFPHKISLLSRARALVSPVTVDEAFGLALVEAMACGTPVLAYARGAVPEVVAHEVTGFVADTYAGLKAAVNRLATLSPGKCRDHVETNFSGERMVNAYLDLYREMIGK